MDLKLWHGFVFMGLKRLTKIEEQLKKHKLLPQVKHMFLVEEKFCDTQYSVCYRDVTSKRRCQSGPQKNVYYTEVSDICLRHGNFSLRVCLSFHPFP